MVIVTPDGRTAEPAEETLGVGTLVYRVHSNRFGAAEFNPGPKIAVVKSRFAFFGKQPVPVLYGAETPDAAISETILHDIPIGGGRIDRNLVQSKILSPLVTTRPLRLLSPHGHGFRRLGVVAEDITRTPPRYYKRSVPWAEAAFDAGFDGMCWMSRHHDTNKVYVFFQRGEDAESFETPAGHDGVRAFAFPQDLNWLTRQLAPLNVDITDA